MTKKRALAIFKDEYSEFLKKHKGDKIAQRQAFHEFVDSLYNKEEITDYQVQNWSNPF